MLQVFGGHRGGAVLEGDLVHDRDGGFGQNAQRGDDDLHLIGADFLDREKRLVLPGEQHIADAPLNKGRGGIARAGIEHRHIGVELVHELLGRGIVAAGLMLGPRPGRQVVPARAAGGLRVRRDDGRCRA